MEVFAVMDNAMHLGGIGEDPGLAVAAPRIILPAAFPEAILDRHELLGDVIADVMLDQLAGARAFGAAVEIAGDDVPADPAIGHVIEARHAAREGQRRLVRQVDGGGKGQVLRRLGHRRDDQQRVVGRHLHGFTQRRIGTAAIDVIDPDDVGKEKSVEPAPLEQLRQRHPVAAVLVVRRLVARMPPQPLGLMPDAVHRKGIETEFASQVILPGFPKFRHVVQC